MRQGQRAVLLGVAPFGSIEASVTSVFPAVQLSQRQEEKYGLPLSHVLSGHCPFPLASASQARTCYENPKGLSMLEARPTETAMAIGALCASSGCSDGQCSCVILRRLRRNCWTCSWHLVSFSCGHPEASMLLSSMSSWMSIAIRIDELL